MTRVVVVGGKRGTEEDALERPGPLDRRLNRVIARRKKRLESDVLAQVAADPFHHKNWVWPGAAAAFPGNPELWEVARYYPFAKGGPLLADTIEDEPEARRQATIKADALRKRGFRYVAVTKAATAPEVEKALQGETLELPLDHERLGPAHIPQ
jgi:hypothetical protein